MKICNQLHNISNRPISVYKDSILVPELEWACARQLPNPRFWPGNPISRILRQVHFSEFFLQNYFFPYVLLFVQWQFYPLQHVLWWNVTILNPGKKMYIKKNASMVMCSEGICPEGIHQGAEHQGLKLSRWEWEVLITVMHYFTSLFNFWPRESFFSTWLKWLSHTFQNKQKFTFVQREKCIKREYV